MSAQPGHNAGNLLCFAHDHPALAGHFPQRPIVPGVLLLDAALYAMEQAMQPDLPPDPAPAGEHSPIANGHVANCDVANWHVATVKFHRLVTPGQPLRLEWHSERHGVNHRARVALHAGQHLVMSATLERRQP